MTTYFTRMTLYVGALLLLPAVASAEVTPPGRYRVTISSDTGNPLGTQEMCITPSQAKSLASWARTLEQPLWDDCTIELLKEPNAWKAACSNSMTQSVTTGRVQLTSDGFEAQTETTMGTMTVKTHLAAKRLGDCR